MYRETIRSFSGSTLGYMEDEGNKIVATDFSGRTLGYYDKSRDTTCDYSGRTLYYGNALAALIVIGR